MAVDLYINFNGNCREAVEFYTQVFDTVKPQIMLFKDAPPSPDFPVNEDIGNLVMHTQLQILGSRIMFSDVPPGMPFTAGNNITLVIGSKDIDEIKKLYEKLKDGGKVEMELQETFWSKSYGSIVDKFGIGWQLSYSEEQA